MNHAFLIGKKVYLRGLEESDLKYIKKWLSDSDFTKFLFQGDFPHSLDKLTENFAKDKKQGNPVFAIIYKKNNKVIGWAGLYEIDWISRTAEIRFFIGEKKYWGKGLATESVSLIIDYGFHKLNLHRIYGGMNEENYGSAKIFQKLGFSNEGRSKDDHFRNGRYYDILRFGLINKKNTHKKK